MKRDTFICVGLSLPDGWRISSVVRDAAICCSSLGSAGTGGGDVSRTYLSRNPPVLIRFTSFQSLPLGEDSSSLPFSISFSLPLALLRLTAAILGEDAGSGDGGRIVAFRPFNRLGEVVMTTSGFGRDFFFAFLGGPTAK